MKRILVSFVGLTVYNNAEYVLSETESHQCCFGQIPLLLYFQREGKPIDSLYCFVTDMVIDKQNATPDKITYDEVKKRNKDKKDGKTIRPNNYRYLEDEIGKREISLSSLKPVIYNENDEGIRFFDMLENNVFTDFDLNNEQVEVYFDTTNAFRSIPLSMLSVVNLVDVMHKNVSVKAIYYWMTLNDKNNRFRLSDISSINRDNRIAAELERFEQTFMISDLNETYFKDAKPDKRLKKLFLELNGINQALQYVNLTDLVGHVEKAQQQLELICGRENNGELLERYLILKPYLTHMNMEYAQITKGCAENDLEIAIRIAEKLNNNEQIQLSVTLLEAVYNEILKRVLEKSGVVLSDKKSSVVYESVQHFDAALGLKQDRKEDEITEARQHTLNNDKYLSNSKMTKEEFTAYYQNLFNTIDSVSQDISNKLPDSGKEFKYAISQFMGKVRNKINHGNLELGSHTEKNKREIKKVVNDYIRVIREINSILLQQA